MKYIRLRHIILFLLMAVFGTPIRASIHTDYLLGGSLIVKADQPYKYNGKELDLMHGLNTYDYGARQYYSIVGRVGQSGPASLRKGKKTSLAMSWKTAEQDCQTDKGPMYRAFAVC